MSNSFFDDEDVVVGESAFFDAEDLGDAGPQDEMPPEPPTQSQAVLEGFSRGATFGLSDEIAGGFEAGGRALGLEGLGGPITDIGLSEEGPTLNPELLKGAYVEGREAQRGREAASSEEHPYTSMGADLVGGLATGGAAIKGIQTGAKTVPKMKQLYDKFKGLSKVQQGLTVGAGEGMLEGAGRSEEELGSQGFMEDLLVGTGLGLAGGAAGGKIAQKLEAKELAKKAKVLTDESNLEAMKSMGAGSKGMSDEIEKIDKFGRTDGSGTFALKEKIVDPFSRPRETYKKVLEKKKEISKGYDTEIGKFNNAVGLSEKQAKSIADDAYRKMDEAIVEELGANDLITKEMRDNLGKNRAKLQQELEAALQGNNPIKELQDLYVRYNKDFFSNAKNQSPTAQARKVLRNEIKNMQRQLVKTLDPESAAKFKELDASYTHLLDLEELTKIGAGKAELQKLGLGDLIQGATARLMGIPLVGEAMVGASMATKKLLKKDLGDLAAGRSAIIKAKTAEDIAESLSKPSSEVLGKASREVIDEAKSLRPLNTINKVLDLGKKATRETLKDVDPSKLTSTGVTTGAAAVDTQKQMTLPQDYRGVIKKAEMASPDDLQAEADTIRQTYGKAGEKLARTLERMKDKDRNGRKALSFSLMQDPAYRKMLQGEIDNEAGAGEDE